MSNTLLTNDIILKMSLMNLKNTLGTAKAANRNYESKFIKGVGDSVRVGIPVQYAGRTTNTISSFEDTTETYVTLTISNVAGGDTTFSQQELSRKVTDFSENYIKPMMITIGNKINVGMMNIMKTGWSDAVGQPGATLSGYAQVDSLKARMEEMSLEDDEFFLGLSTQAASGIRNGTLNLFTPVANDKILMKGSIGMYDSFNTYTDQSILRLTTGTMAGTPLVATVPTTGTNTIALKGFTASQTGVLKAGDKITFAATFAVNKVTYQAYPYLKQFVVQSDVNSDGSGNATVTVSPAFNSTLAYQNIDALPQVNAQVVCLGIPAGTYSAGAVTYTNNFAFTKRGLTLAAPPQVSNPGAVFSKSSTDPDTGVSIGMNVAYTITTNVNQYRWDVYWGGLAFANYGASLVSLY